MAESLAEALQCRSWERALFTTYALSLTFFESVILRLLRQSGCREIWVVADAQGYQSSLMERRSHGVGHEYHLVPFALPHGVFHPKCCYLEGPDGDLLAVGSGNLTFGGFGRNLEVLDVLSPDGSADCFRDFGAFLNALRRRRDVYCPEPIWMDTFADRAFAAATDLGGKPDRWVWLVHSTDTPVLDQLTSQLNRCGSIRRLTVLSPYHDTDGAAVRLLVEQTHAERLEVGLPFPPHISCFPFPVAEGWPVPTTAVRVDLDGDKRNLHAKWMEWDTEQGIVTLTGSVNATSQALLTTNNIEVGILRLDPGGTGWATWKHAPTPDVYSVMEYRSAGLLSTYLIYAELCGTGELRGRIISSQSAAGRWEGLLLKPSGESVAFHADVASGGYFQVFLPEFEDFAFSPALQVTMTLGATVARGWVQNTEILAMPRLRRLGISSLLRLINREETADDDIALLDYLAIHAADHLLTFQHAIRRSPQSPASCDSKDDRQVIRLEELAPIDVSEHGSHGETVLGMTPTSALERIFGQLRRRLLGTAAREKGAPRFTAFESDGTEGDEDGDQQADEQNRVQAALEYFDERMRELVESEGVEPAKLNPLFVLWLEVTLHMLLGRQSVRSAALAFLGSWFRRSTVRCQAAEKTDALEQHVATAAAMLRIASPSVEMNMPQQLHEALEAFWSGSVPVDRAKRSLLVDSRIGLGGLLLDIEPGQLRTALDEILGSRTIRAEIANVLRAHRENTPLPPSPIFESEAGQILRRELVKRSGKLRVKQLSRRESVCPNCYCACCESVASSLQTNRISVCTSCGWVILRTTP